MSRPFQNFGPLVNTKDVKLFVMHNDMVRLKKVVSKLKSKEVQLQRVLSASENLKKELDEFQSARTNLIEENKQFKSEKVQS